MVRVRYIAILACMIPEAVLPSFITSRLISPAVWAESGKSKEGDRRGSSSSVRWFPRRPGVLPSLPANGPTAPHSGGEEQNSSAGFSALRPTISELPGQGVRGHGPCRFCGMADEVVFEWALGHTFMPARLGRVIAASRCVVTDMASIASNVRPHGPPSSL